MADLITTGTSDYATGGIDTATTLVNNVSPTDAKQPNGLAAAVVQIEGILGAGTTLKGNLATLVARLAVCMDADGVLKLSTDAAVTGPLSVAKGGTGGTVAGTVGLLPTGAIFPWPTRVAPTGTVLCYGQALSRTTEAGLFAVLHQSTTVTITIASPGVVSWTAHVFQVGDPVVFTTTGALPTGLTAGTTYYVSSITTNNFQVATAVGGASINTSGTQSGVHTGINAPYGRGDGSTTFNAPDFRGLVLLGLDNMGGTAASRITSVSTGGINSTSLGNSGGAQIHTLSDSEVPSQTISFDVASGSGGVNSGDFQVSAIGPISDGQAARAITKTSEGGGGAHSNTQPWRVVSYVIKT